MKSVLIALVLLFAGSAFAKEVRFTCQPKAFFCNHGSCSWRLQPAGPRYVDLEQDPHYPQPGYPHEVWHGFYQSEIDRHVLSLNINYSEADGFSATATLQQGSVFSETSGGTWIDVSLRSYDYGRGFVCSGFQLIDGVGQP